MLNKLIKEKLVKKHNGRYYVNKGKGDVHIGFKKDATANLKALTPEQIAAFVPFKDEPPQDEKADTKNLSHNDSVPKSNDEDRKIKPDDLILSDKKVLENILDINISGPKKGATDVYIDGINQMRFDHPIVKRCPAFFFLADKKYNVNNGKMLTNRGMSVLSRTMNKALIDTYKVTVNRDDSPLEDFYTIGELVLCVMVKEQFFKKKEAERLKGYLRKATVMAKRQEVANNQAKETDPDVIAANLASVNMSDRKALVNNDKLEADRIQKVLASENISDAEKSDLIKSIDAGDGVQMMGL